MIINKFGDYMRKSLTSASDLSSVEAFEEVGH